MKERWRYRLTRFFERTLWTFAVIFGVVIFTLPRPSTLIALQAKTETIEIEIVDPGAANFFLRAARDKDTQECYKDVEIYPSLGSRLYYTKALGEEFIIAIDGEYGIKTVDSDVISEKKDGTFGFSENDFDCRSATLMRLPTNGVLDVGIQVVTDFVHQPPLPLHEGRITVYGRSIQGLLYGLIPINWASGILPVKPGSLYEADAVDIPAGASLSTRPLDERQTAPFWWGFADVDLSGDPADGAGMSISASSNAINLTIAAPAPKFDLRTGKKTALEPDVLALSSQAQNFADPTFRWIVFLFGAVGAVITVVHSVLSRQK